MTPLATIVRTSQRVAETRSRREKIDHLAACLRALAPEEIEAGVAFLAGDIRQGRIGIGYATIRDTRDRRAAPAPGLTVLEVDRALDEIATTAGRGSKARRQDRLDALLHAATEDEQQFLRRLLVGELRQGALEAVMVEAIAAATGVPAAGIRRATMLSGDVRAVAVAVLRDGGDGLGRFALELFRPVQPMLARSAGDVTDALGRIERAAFEWKLDGARVQVHRDGDAVRVFSRRLNEVTAAVPEIVEAVRRLPVRSIVLDGEAIALRADGAPLPFQVTMRRFGRRIDVERMRAEIPITPVFFDCLHLDGRDLIDETAGARASALAGVAGADTLVPRLVTAETEAAQAFLDDALRHGHEGVVAKSLDAAYEAGRRGAGWLKVKPVLTLDLVVLAAEWGSGRRRGWLSNLHLGARDPEGGGFVMLGKTFKGLTDELLAWQTEQLQAIAIGRDEYTVYVQPTLVVEIAFDGVQTSPHYPGGMALRFARVKRYRPDRRADDADTIDRVRAIHAAP